MNEDELDDSQTLKIDSWLARQQNQKKLLREDVMLLARAVRMDIEELYEKIEESAETTMTRLGDLSDSISMVE